MASYTVSFNRDRTFSTFLNVSLLSSSFKSLPTTAVYAMKNTVKVADDAETVRSG